MYFVGTLTNRIASIQSAMIYGIFFSVVIIPLHSFIADDC
nr:MAG TPA: hypothetical protein [Caudoviricetes sp.]